MHSANKFSLHVCHLEMQTQHLKQIPSLAVNALFIHILLALPWDVTDYPTCF